MKRLIPLTLAVFLLVLTPLMWQTPGAQVGNSTTSIYDAFAFESITVSTAVKTFTAATMINARAANCSTETDSIRYRFDSGDPSSTVGHSAAANSTLAIYGINNLRNFKMIRSGSGDATVRCTYSR